MRGPYESNFVGGQNYKKFALKAAKNFGYSKEVIQKIKRSKSDQEISTIMHIAAKGIGENNG